MREIKFRGKRIDNGEWVYGYYIHTGQEYHGEAKHLIAINGSIIDYAGLKFIEVIPETVGQFTGLHDKNGKEIYEGDICKVFDGTNSIAVVEYNLGGFCFKWKHMDNSRSATIIYATKELEIIGNIHENPELMS